VAKPLVRRSMPQQTVAAGQGFRSSAALRSGHMARASPPLLADGGVATTLEELLDHRPSLAPSQRLLVACVGVGAAGAPLVARRQLVDGRSPLPFQLACSVAGLGVAALCRHLLLERAWADLALSAEAAADEDSLFQQVGRARVHYKARSAAQPRAAAALLHGFGANEGSYQLVLGGLAAGLDAVVVAPDAPGFGLTSRGADIGQYSLAVSAVQAMAVLSRAAHPLPPAAPRLLIGHSLGALTAVRAAAAAPAGSVAALVLVAPAIPGGAAPLAPVVDTERAVRSPGAQPRSARAAAAATALRLVGPLLTALLRMAVRSRRFWERSLAAVRGDGAVPPPPLLAAYRRPGLVRGWEAGMLRFVAARLTDEPMEPAAAELARLAASGVRVLIVHGERDRVVPPANSRLLAACVPGSCLELMAGIGHCPQEEAPELFTAMVVNWWKVSPEIHTC